VTLPTDETEGEIRWFEQAPSPPQGSDRPRTPLDLWVRCPGCKGALFRESLQPTAQVCPSCGHHMGLHWRSRISLVVDPESFVQEQDGLSPTDRLGFADSKPYASRLAASRRDSGEDEAYAWGRATIGGQPVVIGSFCFSFLGGSMGSVVGERITRQIERGIELRQPVIIISASGGARMQEGVLSLMQMAKTSAALARLRDEVGAPYISLLCHPTTGGVAASFAMLGDLILAEPNALIGFAGPRVIEQTIGQSLPPGFQTSEYLLEHGMVDAIVPRAELRARLRQCLALLWGGR
jgi:acetyl-CoA carboxylase carboxyl transferase subunit beta